LSSREGSPEGSEGIALVQQIERYSNFKATR